MRVLAFGTYDTRLHPRVKGIIEGLETHGHTVRELNLPLGLSTADKVSALKNPLRLPRLAFGMLSKWMRLAWQSRRFHGKNQPDAILVGYMGHFDVVLARLLFPRTTIVLDHLISAAGTARDRGESQGLKIKLLAALDRLATRCADIVVTDTEEHRQQLPADALDRGVVALVGAPRDWFAADPKEHVQRDTPRIVFYGLFTPLQGAPTIGRAIRILADRGVEAQVTLIGDGQDAAEVKQLIEGLPVRWETWVEAEQLPAEVADHDICLGVFGTTSKALNVVPNKVYQGAAAGCAIVTSDTAPQRRVLGDSAVLVAPGDAEALADALQRLVEDPALLQRQRERARELANREFTPERLAAPIVERLS